MKIITIIPARLASTRLPRKPLALIAGKTMIQRVYEQAVKANIGEVIIATDSQEITAEINKFGGKYILTNPDLPSGTDRIFEAYKKFISQNNLSFDIILNLQGDLPNIEPRILKECVEFASNNDCDIATVASKITDLTEITNPNVVKIAIASNNLALYFSRSAIPYSKKSTEDYFHHIGIYAYKKKALEQFVALPPSPLEKRESLEQLRALENHMKIAVKIVDTHPLSVDTADDLVKVTTFINSQN